MMGLGPVPAVPAPVPDEARGAEHSQVTARSFDATYEQPTLRGHWWRSRLEAVVRLVGDGPGLLLEVGCGSGRVLAALAARGWEVSGIDPAKAMLDLAGRRTPSTSLVIARAETLPFADGEFDAVVAAGVLEYADLPTALRELARVLRPGGRAVIVVRRMAPIRAWHRTVVLPLVGAVKRLAPFGRPLPMRRRRPMSLAQARDILAATGLIVEHTENVGCALLPDPIDGLAPGLAYRAAGTAERSRRLRRMLGTQRVLVATKSGGRA